MTEDYNRYMIRKVAFSLLILSLLKDISVEGLLEFFFKDQIILLAYVWRSGFYEAHNRNIKTVGLLQIFINNSLTLSQRFQMAIFLLVFTINLCTMKFISETWLVETLRVYSKRDHHKYTIIR